jgi:probable FeS assembly SUF system protein SufT
MDDKQPIALTREVAVITIPYGTAGTLPAGAHVRIMQRLGGSFTISDARGGLYRIDAADADALGVEAPAISAAPEPTQTEAFNEKRVWDELKTVFDPEIPVNIVDLGLIYSCNIQPVETGGHKIDISMSMTAPGCGMANVIKGDVETQLRHLPGVKDVHVEVVFDPPWSAARMTPAAKLQLGLDADYGMSSSPFPTYPGR